MIKVIYQKTIEKLNSSSLGWSFEVVGFGTYAVVLEAATTNDMIGHYKNIS